MVIVEQTVEWELAEETDVLEKKKSALVPLCPPEIPHELTWTRTRGAAVGTMALP
jgi:hypothetical protein